MRTRGLPLVAVLLAVLVAGCAGGPARTGAGPTEGPTAVATPTAETTPTVTASATAEVTLEPTQEPTAEPTVAPTVEATPTVEVSPLPTVSAECMAGAVAVRTAGQLTIGADNPAYPPWFGGDPATQYPGEPADGVEWEIGDPYSGEGYESAVAYEVAERLGFAREAVRWVYVPFNLSFRPGPKDFDLYLTQVSYRPRRAEVVDFSESYYDVNQAVVALEGTPIAAATTIDALKAFRLGAAVGTTSYDTITDVVAPTTEPRVYDDNDKALRALNNGQIDGVVVDLPTAFYMRDAQLQNGVVVGQFPTLGEQEYFGVVLQKGSTVTACINQALAAMRADGTLDAIYEEWLADKAEAPVFE